MKFTRLRLRSYRGIAAAEVSFAPDGITLVQGRNEAGKTSLGEAILLLFEYADSSKHRDIEAVLPVHRDEGPEIELEAESGPYAFTYFKRFRKKPETRLTVSRPKGENLTGRPAHDRAQAILRETLDVALWKALSVQQGDGIAQPGLAGQTSLSAALDRVAGGHPADPRAEDLFGRVRKEYLRYCTEGGAEQKKLGDARKARDEARAMAAHVEQALTELEADVDRAAALQREIAHLGRREAELAGEVAAHDAQLKEIGNLESARTLALQRLESARKTEMVARRDAEARQGLVDALAVAARARRDMEDSAAVSQEALKRAGLELEAAAKSADEADLRRREADRLASLRRADFDYYSDRLHLEQFRERKDRIDRARKSAARAEELLSRSKLDAGALQKIQDAEKALLAANARLEMGAPSVTLRALSDCIVVVDGVEIRLGREESRTISVPERSAVSVPGVLDVEIAAGSSAEGLAGEAGGALRALEDACRAAGVADADEARKAFEERREAARQVEGKSQVEEENLWDLTYEGLKQRLLGLEASVPDYIARRTPGPAICPDRDSAQEARAAAEAARELAGSEWDMAGSRLGMSREVRDARSAEHQEVRVRLSQVEKGLLLAQEALEQARKGVPDEDLQAALKEAVQAVSAEQAGLAEAEASLAARNPDRARALAETAKASLETTASRRSSAKEELIAVQTRLKIHGEEGLHEKRHAALVRLERLELENRALFARAAAARRLHDTMAEERDRARRAYVAPLKARIERLGRLVFDDTFGVNISDGLQIESRTLGGVTVPFNSLSGGTREQLSLIFRLTCSMIVAGDGGVPIILDDALGYTDPERLRLMGAVLARAARECQIIIFTCVPDRYGHIGQAAVVPLD